MNKNSLWSEFTLVMLALGRSLVSMLYPRMWFALFLPFIIALFLAIVLFWFLWTPLVDGLQAGVVQLASWSQSDFIQYRMLTPLVLWWLTHMLAVFILVSIPSLLGLLLAAMFVVPVVLKHLGKHDYPELTQQGSSQYLKSIGNSLWSTFLFIVLWLVTLPLWLIPFMPVILPILLWAFLFKRLMSVDTLLDYASPDEYRLLHSKHNKGYWLLGGLCAVLNLLPPAWLVLPVFSSLLFSHYGLERLRRYRLTPFNTES